MTEISQLLAHRSLGEPQSHGSLTMFPVLNGGGTEPRYLPLREALARGTVVLEEVSDAGSVPRLAVRNDGDIPVLLVDGEELVGAKQNRVVNVSLLVAAHTVLAIPVSCVEQGRWRYRSRHFGDSGQAIFSDARRRNHGDVERNLKQRGVRDADQGRVWNDIRRKMGSMGTASETGAMHDVYEQAAASLGQYHSTFQPVDGQLGALFLLAGGWCGLDLFDAPATLRAMFPKLLNSWALDALEPRPAAEAAIPRNRAEAFLAAVALAEPRAYPAVGLGQELRLEGGGVVGAALVHEGSVVHLAAFERGA